MSKNKSKQEVIELLYREYKSLTLSRKECAKALGVSMATLDRWRVQPIPYGPKVQTNANGSKTAVLYSIVEIAEFLISK